MTNAFTIPKESTILRDNNRMFRPAPKTAKATNMHPIVLPGSNKAAPLKFMKVRNETNA